MRENLSETELPHSFKPVIRFSKCKKFRKDAAGRYLKAAFDGLIIHIILTEATGSKCLLTRNRKTGRTGVNLTDTLGRQVFQNVFCFFI